MAKFKTLPNYEFIRDGLHIVFNGYGIYETNDEKIIKALEGANPFIERVDKPEVKQDKEVDEKPKETPSPAKESEKKDESKPTAKPKQPKKQAKK